MTSTRVTATVPAMSALPKMPTMVVVLAALLSVAGCGGSSAAGGAVRPTGKAVPGAQPNAAAARAAFPFPADIKIMFTSPKPADATNAGIIDGFEYVYQGYYYALHTKGKDRRFFQRMEHEALFNFSKTFDGAVKAKYSVVGTLRFFNTRVSSTSGTRGAAVGSCVDESQWRTKNLRTGKTTPTAKRPARRQYMVTAAMRRGDDGIWRMFDFSTYHLPDARAKECQQ